MKILIDVPAVDKDLLTSSDIAKITKICMNLEKALGGRILNFEIKK